MFLTTLPPPHSRGPLGQNVATSHVHTTTTRIVFLKFNHLLLSQEVIFLFLNHLTVHCVAFLISLLMDLFMGYPMGHIMELLMHHLIDHSMDRSMNLMGTGINNLLTPLNNLPPPPWKEIS